MAKYIPYNFRQSTLVEIDFLEQLQPGTFEFAIHYLIENKLDLSIFDNHYKNDATVPAPLTTPRFCSKSFYSLTPKASPAAARLCGVAKPILFLKPSPAIPFPTSPPSPTLLAATRKVLKIFSSRYY